MTIRRHRVPLKTDNDTGATKETALPHGPHTARVSGAHTHALARARAYTANEYETSFPAAKPFFLFTRLDNVDFVFIVSKTRHGYRIRFTGSNLVYTQSKVYRYPIGKYNVKMLIDSISKNYFKYNKLMNFFFFVHRFLLPKKIFMALNFFLAKENITNLVLLIILPLPQIMLL